ncbi:MAG: UbiD family decarboxylase [Devosia sp.]|nr:UbiD family decarboxylase [Devosia sp.]
MRDQAEAYVPADLQNFVARLDRLGLVKTITRPVSLVHEMTEIHRRVLAAGGPALLFTAPVLADGSVSRMPVLANLFGTRERIALGLGQHGTDLAGLGALLAELRQPTPPRDLAGLGRSVPLLQAALNLGTRLVHRPSVQAEVALGEAIDLTRLPIQWCWPGEPAPLITWPLVVTCSPDDPSDINVGIYRLQLLGRNRLIVRWLAQRGGAGHHRAWRQHGRDMPIAIAIGADPALVLAAVMPLPEGMSELDFAGVLRGQRTRVSRGRTVDLPIPADAEIVIEGTVSAEETAEEGPYGDHTGYYNAVERFPVVSVSAVTMRRNPIYLSTFTGRPPDEPSVLGEAMTEIFAPIVRAQFPEIRDIHLPPEACSYRAIVVAIDKRYPGQARRLMLGLWSMLPQFTYAKLIIVVDPDIDVRRWSDVIWALSTRFDASRDLVRIDDTPIDYLDFASPQPGLGGKLGLDATNKIGPETTREWGRPLAMPDELVARVDGFWNELGLGRAP